MEHASSVHKPSPPTPRHGRLQRKCACGTQTTWGKCEDCRKKQMNGTPLQTKLTIGQPGDVYELEADRVAEQVMRMPAAKLDKTSNESMPRPSIRQPAGGGNGHSEAPSIHETAGPAAGSLIAHEVVSSDGQLLDASTRAFFELRFGHDFRRVRIHTDAKAAHAAAAVNAKAYTIGPNIVFGAEQYAPWTTEGRRFMAHELTHIVQQNGSVSEASNVELAINNFGPTYGIGGFIQRKCNEHNRKAFYETAPNYCKDDDSTGQLHPGKICFRKFPVKRNSYNDCPPGDHVCFDPEGRCDDHEDKVSPVASKKSDGTCRLHAQCSLEHAIKDKVLEDWFHKKGIEQEVHLPGEADRRELGLF